MRALPSVSARLPLLGAAMAGILFYVVAPALTLLRLDRAVREGDRAVLARLVDWRSVRRGLAREAAGGVLGMGANGGARAGEGLPPFGFSFVRGIADREMAARLTPEGLIHLAGAAGRAGAPGAAPRLAGAWLDGPTRLSVRVRVAGEARPIRLGLQLERGGWKLARLWLPRGMLRRAAAAAGAAARPARAPDRPARPSR